MSPGCYSIEGACRWREDARRVGQRVCLTNGCFDLLHAGHVQLLHEARVSADALVVALNSDASVRRLKGAGRPYVPALERAELLCALESVDQVVIFEEDTPLKTILMLRPELLVKGADWARDQIVGAKEIESWGGKLLRVPLRPGLSSSALVARVRERCRGE